MKGQGLPTERPLGTSRYCFKEPACSLTGQSLTGDSNTEHRPNRHLPFLSPESIVCSLRNWTHFRARLLTGQWIDADPLHLRNSRNPPPSRATSAWYSTNQDERRDQVRTRRSRATAPPIVTLPHRAFLLWGQGPERASEKDRIGYIKRGQSKPHLSAYQRSTGVQCHHQHVGCWAWEGVHTQSTRGDQLCPRPRPYCKGLGSQIQVTGPSPDPW